MEEIIKEKNKNPILIMGDLNASDKFRSSEIEYFKDMFIKMKNIGFIDCTENIAIDERSTMLDYSYQNDYVFINNKFKNDLLEIKIRKDIETEYVYHYPIDIKIKL